jgi:hypothetical protein
VREGVLAHADELGELGRDGQANTTLQIINLRSEVGSSYSGNQLKAFCH